VRNPAHWAEKYLSCVNVGVPACEKPLINWALARKITRLSSYPFSGWVLAQTNWTGKQGIIGFVSVVKMSVPLVPVFGGGGGYLASPALSLFKGQSTISTCVEYIISLQYS
jgi:hypothetical protein